MVETSGLEPHVEGELKIMATSFANLFWPALIHGLGIALRDFLEVFASHPWPFLGAGAIALVSALLSRVLRRRR
jgi:hypothetical protein